MEHLSNHVIRENKRNGYKEVLNKAALDRSKEIAAEGIVSWSAANWMESEYPYLTRKEAEALGKTLVKKSQSSCSRCVLSIRNTGKPRKI